MAGKRSSKRPSPNWYRVSVRQAVGSLGIASTVAITAGCSDLDEGQQSYCDLNPDVGTCLTTDQPNTSDPWWCMGQAPAPLPPPQGRTVGFVQPVFDWGSRVPLAGTGLQATLCSSFDLPCAMPLAPPQIIRPGMIGPVPFPPEIPAAAAAIAGGVAVVEGFDGYIKFTVERPTASAADQFIPNAYYLGGEVSGPITTGGPIFMLTNRLRDMVLQNSFSGTPVTVTEQRGMVAVSTYDCNGNVVRGGRVEIEVAGVRPEGILPFQVPASRVPLSQPQDQPLTTSVAGIAGFLNVPPGTVEVIAYRPGTDDRFGSIELGSVAGQLTLGPILPEYRQDASVSRPPDESMADMAGN